VRPQIGVFPCYLPGALEATGQIAYPSRRQPNSDGRDGVAWGDGTHTAKGTGHEHTHSTVTRAARLWQCNIAIGSYAVPGEWGWMWPLLIAPHLVFAFSHAGRSVGVDLFLYHWLSKDPTGQTGIGRFLRYWV